MTRYSTTMSEILSQIREGFSPKEIKMAIGIAADKRYARGNYSGAVNQIEKIKKGLSQHPQVAAVLKRLNTDYDPSIKEEDEPASPDESGMASDQLKFIVYAANEIMQHIQGGGEFPEWMQNKLSGTHEKMKGLHANINHDNVESVEEELDLDEMKMDDPKLVKTFDKLKKGSTVKLKTSSTISKGKDFVDYVVKSKNMVNKGRVEKITLVTKGNEGAVKKFLYKRDGKVTFAIGDMGASIDDIKEGTWHMADNPKDIAALKKLMSKPIKLGKEGDDAVDVIGRFIGDDELYDDLYVDGNKNPNGDARKTIIKWFQNRIKKNDYGLGPKTKDLGKQIGLKMEYVPEETELEEAMLNLKLVTYQAKEALGKIRHKVAKKGNKYIISVDSNDEEDAQKAMKDHPLYVAGKLRVVPESVEESVELEEKLKVSDGLGAWIDDFKKSDAPQFQGKSDEEKKNMAIAAFTDAGGKLDEAVLSGRDYKVKDGKVHISKANFKKVSKDYKNDTRGKERMVVLDPKTQATVSMPVVFEETDLNELREPYAVVDTADGNKVVGTASDEKGAKSIISTSQLPPMKIKDKKTLKIVKVKKKQMIGYPIKEEEGEPQKPDSAKAVDQMRDDKKKTRIAQLQLQIAKAQETINKLNAQEKPKDA